MINAKANNAVCVGSVVMLDPTGELYYAGPILQAPPAEHGFDVFLNQEDFDSLVAHATRKRGESDAPRSLQ